MIGEAIIGGFTSKIINDCVDISKAAIKKADKERKSKGQSLQSRIYQVLIDALNKTSSNQYKGKDVIYDAAESILKGFKGGECDRISVVKSGLQVFLSFIDDDKCEEFMEILRHEIAQDENFDIYREILLVLLEQQANDDQNELQEIKEILKEVTKKLDEKNIDSQSESIKQTVKNRTQEYADKWNANMFLNDFDKRNKSAGVNVKLSEVYLEKYLPHYIWGNNKNPDSDLKTLLSEYINEKNDNKMLLILGQPGIGKSTLITWLTANFTTIIDEIMIYQFASDLKDIDWQKSNISVLILEKLGLSYDGLNGKTLILDGFDEVSVGVNRKDILDQLYDDLIYKRIINNFKLIITCRVNYIQDYEWVKCEYVTLQTWDEEQIKSFCARFQEKTKYYISEHTIAKVIESKDILGIPLILYMVLALNISIEKEGSIVDIYDKIFSLKGGIYDRCIENKNFADNHRIGEIKKQIHQISREIAIWMFENNPNEAYIPQKAYEKICDSVIKEGGQENKDIKQDFKIGNYFKSVKHSEGIEKLYFVHRSIYEYFVAETIYSSIEHVLLELSEEGKKELSGNIAVYLKAGRITNTIGEYLQYMILKLYQSLNNEKKEIFYQWWESTVDMMMIYGMFYFTKRNIQDYKDVIYNETQCFANFLIILGLLLKTGKNNYIMQNVNKAKAEIYIKLIFAQSIRFKYLNFRKMSLRRLNLVGADLREADLREADLSEADLERADLGKANLREAYLRKAKLREAYLRGTYLLKADLGKADLYRVELVGANLEGADIIGANLEGSGLERANLKGASLVGANLKGASLISAKLDDSFWLKSDIEEVLPLLKPASFQYINVYDDDNKVRKVYRSELFPDENKLSNL